MYALLMAWLLHTASPTPEVRLEVHVEPDAAQTWKALADLGFKGEGRQYTMPAKEFVSAVKGCIVTEWGTLPAANLEAARRVPGVDVMQVGPVR